LAETKRPSREKREANCFYHRLAKTPTGGLVRAGGVESTPAKPAGRPADLGQPRRSTRPLGLVKEQPFDGDAIPAPLTSRAFIVPFGRFEMA